MGGIKREVWNRFLCLEHVDQSCVGIRKLVLRSLAVFVVFLDSLANCL